MEEKKAVLKVRMFGGFTITYQGKAIQVGKKQTTKALQMLQALLHAGTAGLTRGQILEYIFGREPEGDVSNNLSVTVYHLRKLLRESGLPEEKYIQIKGGRYRFVASYPVEVDARIFEELIEKAKDYSGENRIKLLKRACCYYKGHFLPALAGEEWVTVEGARYQGMYESCLEEVCSFLKERREYDDLERLSRYASVLYPFDEWQIWQMESLLARNRTKEAVELYEKTTAMYFDELAAPPSKRMTDFFRRMSRQIQFEVSSFYEIQTELKEQDGNTGAYYCSYPSFVDSYHMAARLMERSGQSVYLILCTIYDERKRAVKGREQMREISDKLSEAIQESLRKGDVFTRYNASQFLIILIGIRKEECPAVISRMDSCFRRRESSRQIRVTYRTASIDCLQEEEEEVFFA